MMNCRHLKCLVLLAFVASLSLSCAIGTYSRTMRANTKSGSSYSLETMNAKIMWKATYLSPEFRSLARDQIHTWMKLPPDAYTEIPAYLTDDGEAAFFVSVYLPKGYPPMVTGVDSFWDITLGTQDGSEYRASSVEPVSDSPRERRLFPYMNKWDKVYIVKFPVAPIEEPFELAIRSAGVTSFLRWK